MDKNTYCIPEAKREVVAKRINNRLKKAARYGATLKVSYGEPYEKEIPVYDIDEVTQTKYKIGTALYEVFDLTIESEPIRYNGYSIVACIEHLDGGNIITLADVIKPEWTTLRPYCDHCHASRGQKKTFIVRHEDGTEKQVGSTCLQDYCGINPQAIGWAYSISELMDEYIADDYDFRRAGIDVALETDEVLALAVEVVNKYGYRATAYSDSNKDRIFEMLKKNTEPSVESIAKAREIAERVKQMTTEECVKADLNNIKSLVLSGYCKKSHVGFIAYAPVAFNKYLERLEEQRLRADREAIEREKSQYVGEVGQRVVITPQYVKMLTSWESQFGTTFLYKIVDEADNVYIWYASSSSAFNFVEDGIEKYALNRIAEIKATIKAHNERDGIKQTILNRCKVTKITPRPVKTETERNEAEQALDMFMQSFA